MNCGGCCGFDSVWNWHGIAVGWVGGLVCFNVSVCLVLYLGCCVVWWWFPVVLGLSVCVLFA